MLAASGPAMARGLSAAGDLEHARANARAGGPVSEQDAELLERWGLPEWNEERVLQAAQSSTPVSRVPPTTVTASPRDLAA